MNEIDQSLEKPKVQSLKIVFISYLAIWIWSIVIFIDGIRGGDLCGPESSCALVYGSHFGKVFGIPLSELGVIYYFLPLFLIFLITKARKMNTGTEKEYSVVFSYFKVFLVFNYITVGAELYLVYAQIVLGAFCLMCSILAGLVFATAGYVFYLDNKNQWWNHVGQKGEVLPRWVIPVIGLLAVHFVMHPTGGIKEEEMISAKERLEKKRMRLSTVKEIYKKPYEVDSYGERTKKSLHVVEKPEDLFSEKLRNMDSNEIVLLNGETDFDSSIKIGEGKQVAFVAKTIKTNEEYDYKKFLESRIIGDVNAPIRMVVYFNYACSACRSFELNEIPKLIDLVKSKKLMIEYKIFMIEKLPFSDESALVASCSVINQFSNWGRVHRELFKTQHNWQKDGEILNSISEHVDSAKLQKCLVEFDQLDQYLLDETAYARKLGVKTTPTTFIYKNGDKDPYRTVEGKISGEILKELINKIEG